MSQEQQFQPQQAQAEFKLEPEQVKNLENLIQEMPTKYGLPLLNFLNNAIRENASKASLEQASKEQKTFKEDSKQSTEKTKGSTLKKG